MLRLTFTLALTAALAFPSSAQDRPLSRFGVQATVGTTGVGADVATNVLPRVNLRVTASQFSEAFIEAFGVDPDIREEFDGTEFLVENEVDFFQLGAIADVYLLGGLHASGGVVYSRRDLALTFSAQEPVTEGGVTYQSDEIGVLRANGRFGSELAPYLGAGFGNAAGGGRVGFVLEAGVYFTGKPQITLTADDPDSVVAPTANAENEAILEREIGEVLSGVFGSDSVYPEARIGISVRLN